MASHDGDALTQGTGWAYRIHAVHCIDSGFAMIDGHCPAPRWPAAALLLPAVVLLLAPAPARADTHHGATSFVRCAPGPDPFEVRLVPTAHANGAAGTVRLRFAESPFGVAVTADGHHHYDATLTTSGLAGEDGALVVWAATPDLDRVQKLGVLGSDGTLDGVQITFNKFLVFVTAEPSAGVERWSGDILLRGVSPSGRLHTMAGHGPFTGESCGGLFAPWS